VLVGIASSSQPLRDPTAKELKPVVYPCTNRSVMGQGRIHQPEMGGTAQYASLRAKLHVARRAFPMLRLHMQSSLDSNGKPPAEEAKAQPDSRELRQLVSNASLPWYSRKPPKRFDNSLHSLEHSALKLQEGSIIRLRARVDHEI